MENLGIDPKLLLAQVVNFLIFFFVFKKFIAKPFAEFVSNERKKEVEKEKMMKELDEKHQRMTEEERKWRMDLVKEKEEILASTKKIAEDVKAETLEKTKKEADQMIAKAEKQLQTERQELLTDIKKKTIDLSTHIVEKGLKDYLTDQTKRDLTKHIVNNLGKDISKYEN